MLRNSALEWQIVTVWKGVRPACWLSLGRIAKESARGQKRRSARLAERSASPPRADVCGRAAFGAIRVPGAMRPWVRGEQRLVDAVSLTPVPIESAIAASADTTIAVNLLGRARLY